MSASTNSESTAFAPAPWSKTQIEAVIPHRDPFLLIDEITELTEEKIVAIRRVKESEYYFKGHFPNNPVMPGVLILEAMAQALGVLANCKKKNHQRLGYFASAKEVRFREIVKPGDTLRIEVIKTKEKNKFIVALAKSYVGEKVACEGELMLFLAD